MRKHNLLGTAAWGVLILFNVAVIGAAVLYEEPEAPVQTPVARPVEEITIVELPQLRGVETLAGIDLEHVELLPAEAVAEPAPELWTDYDAELIGRTIWGEAGGVKDPAERAAVAWCILNRVDAWGQTIEQVVTKPRQFTGYRPKGDCPQEHIDMARDVLERWAAEKAGEENVGRVLPAGYLYFLGDGKHNHFTIEWKGTNTWDWSLTSPY